MNKFPSVYIIILNYNSYDETITCVKSLEKTLYSDYKIIIVDNNSEDNSVPAIKEAFPQHTLLVSEENLGYASGNNIGIKYSLMQGAEYVCILNNDVIVEKDFLNSMIELFQSDDNIGMVGPCICEYSQRNTIQAMGAHINLYRGLAMGLFKGAKYDTVGKNKLEVDYLGGACFVIKVEVFNNIGLIPEIYFLFYEETEFCLKAKQFGYKLICLPESRVYHKGSATISKYSGLSYYFLNRNRIVFMRRNADIFHKIIFALYITVETIGRIIIRKESFRLFKYYFQGLIADKDNMDSEKVEFFLKK